MLSINWTTYVWAVVHENIIETALGYFISPLFTMILGFAVLRETMRTAHRAVIALAVVAIVILTYSYGRPPYLALIIAGSWSIYGYLKKQVPLSSLESLTAEVVALLIPAVAILFWCFNRADSVPNNADFCFVHGLDDGHPVTALRRGVTKSSFKFAWPYAISCSDI